MSVKVTDISKAGTLLAGVGTRGVSDVSGLTFTVADQNALEAQARDKAIADAQSKAKDLAGALGVSLIRITGFNENQGVVPMPDVCISEQCGSNGCERPRRSADPRGTEHHHVRRIRHLRDKVSVSMAKKTSREKPVDPTVLFKMLSDANRYKAIKLLMISKKGLLVGDIAQALRWVIQRSATCSRS